MRLSLIAAVGENGVIGRSGRLPWHLPADLERFKALTMGHHLLLGRKTFEAIGRPLAGRRMVVVSRGAWTAPPGVEVVGSPQEAVARAAAAGESEAFVAGGGEIYRALLPQADRVYLTRVKAAPQGDTLFPELPASAWRLVSRQERAADERNAHDLLFLVYERQASAARTAAGDAGRPGGQDRAGRDGGARDSTAWAARACRARSASARFSFSWPSWRAAAMSCATSASAARATSRLPSRESSPARLQPSAMRVVAVTAAWRSRLPAAPAGAAAQTPASSPRASW
jgi:dihydrofolate reductase